MATQNKKGKSVQSIKHQAQRMERTVTINKRGLLLRKGALFILVSMSWRILHAYAFVLSFLITSSYLK
ncbi:hypothetical protein BAOM_0654 [Peribacillus asahii]|uniref:Uncharacterized protein n=1 Tax=Peribacillus asahii TaxID=228899 RepID=A0A3Q9RL40_9BACI|nr:hypothetical protein BAOM_0654 [Peribacillus asahii]